MFSMAVFYCFVALLVYVVILSYVRLFKAVKNRRVTSRSSLKDILKIYPSHLKFIVYLLAAAGLVLLVLTVLPWRD